jgi:hypothetical protein
LGQLVLAVVRLKLGMRPRESVLERYDSSKHLLWLGQQQLRLLGCARHQRQSGPLPLIQWRHVLPFLADTLRTRDQAGTVCSVVEMMLGFRLWRSNQLDERSSPVTKTIKTVTYNMNAWKLIGAKQSRE